MVDNLALPAPANLRGTATAPNRIDIAWDAVVDPNLKNYVVDRGPAPGAETTLTSVPLDKTTWTSTNLSPGTQYCWDVRTITLNNERSGPSNEVCLTTPATSATPAPTGVTATAISDSRITVSWSAVTGASVYHVFLAQVTGITTGPFSQVASVTAPATSTVIANLSPATTYAFHVTAVAVSGESAASTPDATAMTFQLGLEGLWKFDDSATLARDSAGFHRDATLASAAFSPDHASANVLNKSSLAVSADSASQATVPATGAFRFAGAAFSLSVWAKLPAAGSADIVGMRNAGCGTLGWKLGQDATNQLSVTGQGGTRSFGTSLAAGEWTHVAFTYDPTTTTLALYVNGAPVAASLYTPRNSLTTTPLSFGHVGGCAGGAVMLDELHIFSRTLSASEISQLGTLPQASPVLSVSAPDASHEVLSWTAVPNANQYYVFRGTNAGDEQFLTSVAIPSLTFTGQHLTPLTQFSWFVRATIGGDPYSTSNEVVQSTPDVLAAPATVTATPVSTSRITVSWSAVTGATSYKIFQSTSATGPFSQVGALLSPATSFQVANLTTKTTYFYEVLAVDGGANLGHLSTPVSATTP
ncbi:MAG TPA: fibronectin type III domain-containing protein [Kofleriaceae bacterium]